MAAPSLGFPAGDACPAYSRCLELETPGREAICRRCYAQKGRYKWKPVKTAQMRRWTWWKAASVEERLDRLVEAMWSEGSPSFFRCYDSGDIEGEDDARTWLMFVDRLPKVNLWIPTRTWVLDSFMPFLRKLNEHPRIVVRPSALFFGDQAPKVEGLSAGGSAPLDNAKPGLTADRVCPGQCGECRVCWLSPEMSVEYHRK